MQLAYQGCCCWQCWDQFCTKQCNAVSQYFCTIRLLANLSRGTFFCFFLFVCLYFHICIFIFSICAFAFALFLALLMGHGPISAERHFVYSCLYICIYIYICVFSISAFTFLYYQFEHLHLCILYLSNCICTISCTLDGPISGESLFACLFACAVDRPISAGLTLFVPKRGLKSVNSWPIAMQKIAGKRTRVDISHIFCAFAKGLRPIPAHSTLFVTKQGLISVDSKHCYKFIFFHECCAKAKGKRFVNDAGTLCCEDKRAIFTSFQVQCNSSSQSISYVNKWICGFSRNFNTKAINKLS